MKLLWTLLDDSLFYSPIDCTKQITHIYTQMIDTVYVKGKVVVDGEQSVAKEGNNGTGNDLQLHIEMTLMNVCLFVRIVNA